MIRRSAILISEAIAFVLAGVLVLALLAVLRLSQGPVSVDFLTPYVEDALAEGTYATELGATEARWQGLNAPLTLTVSDVTVFTEEGRDGTRRAVAQFPQVELTLAWESLLRWRVVPRELVLVNPRLWARRDAEGVLGFGFGGDPARTGGTAAPQAPAAPAETADDPEEMDAGEAVEQLMGLLAGSLDQGGRTALSRVEITDGRLVVTDERAGLAWRGERVAATFTRQVNALNGIFELSLEATNAGALGFVQGSVMHSLAEGTSEIELILDRVEPVRLARVLLASPEGQAFDMPDMPDMPDMFDMEMPRIDVPLRGVVAARLAPDFSLRDATFDLSAENGSIAHDALFFRPLAFERIGIAGRYAAEAQRLDLTSVTVRADPFAAQLTGSASRQGDYWDVAASLSATDLPVDRLELYWPRGIGRSIGDWVIANTFGGAIDTFDAAGQLRIGAGGSGRTELVSLDGAFSGQGVNVSPLQGLPPIRDLRGTATFDATRLDIAVPEGRTLDARLSEGRVTITGFGGPKPDADIEFVAAGALETGLYYLNRPRLRLIDKLGIETEGSQGRVAGRVRLRFPIDPKGSLDDISAVAAANIRDGVFQITDDWRLTGMSATLSVDQAAVNLDGTAALRDVPIAFTARRLLGSEETFATRVDFDADIDADQLSGFGIPPVPSLFGPIGVSVALREGENEQIVELRADLSQAGLAIPQIEWAKPVGEPALVTSTTRLFDWAPQSMPEFAFEGSGLQVRGGARFEPSGEGVRLASLDIGDFILRDNDLRGTITRREDDLGWLADVTGRSLSLRPLVRRVSGGGAGAAAPAEERRLTDEPVLIAAEIDRVVLGDDRILHGMEGTFAHDGRAWTSISLDGTAVDPVREDSSDIAVRYSQEARDGRNFRVSTRNVGTVLSALNVTDQVYGGEMALTAFLDVRDEAEASASENGEAGGPQAEEERPAMVGEVVMTSYRVARAPAMAQLLVALSLNGLQGELEDEGILFNGLEANFTFDQGILTLSDGNTGGSGLGLTLDGTLDTRAAEFDMDGTIVPLRGINRLLNQVPLLGDLLGGENEGLFAFTYSIKGPVSEPRTTVNPLSLLAPGALREIFRFEPAPVREGDTLDEGRVGETD